MSTKTGTPRHSREKATDRSTCKNSGPIQFCSGISQLSDYSALCSTQERERVFVLTGVDEIGEPPCRVTDLNKCVVEYRSSLHFPSRDNSNSRTRQVWPTQYCFQSQGGPFPTQPGRNPFLPNIDPSIKTIPVVSGSAKA
jgi:hypothetical protein